MYSASVFGRREPSTTGSSGSSASAERRRMLARSSTIGRDGSTDERYFARLFYGREGPVPTASIGRQERRQPRPSSFRSLASAIFSLAVTRTPPIPRKPPSFV